MKKILNIFDRGLTWADFLWRIIGFAFVFFGGTIAGLSAKASDIFKNSSPLIWIFISLATSLTIILILYLFNLSRKQSAEKKYFETLSIVPFNINPISENFENTIIRLSDLYLPLNQHHAHKTFKNCKITGPGAIFLAGGSFNNTGFLQCGDVLAIPTEVELPGVITLLNCTLNRCELINLTIIISNSKTNIDDIVRMGGRVIISDMIKDKNGLNKINQN